MISLLKISVILITLAGISVACGKDASKEEQNSQKKVENLITFARLYGYARWFHPSDEAQEIDWDKFAVLGVQKVENIKSTAALRDTLYHLFSPVVQGLQIYETQKPQIFNQDILLSPDPDAKPVAWQHYGVSLNNQSKIYASIRTNQSRMEKGNDKAYNPDKIFDRVPQFGEITKEPLGNNLTCVVPLTLLTNGTSTYPQTDRSTFARLKSELSDIIIINSFNPQINLASVIIAWNVLQHFFPYFDVIDTDWNEVLEETLKCTFTNKEKKDFFVTLSQMLARIHDGHGIVYNEQMYHLPIRAEFIEDKIVITGSNDPALKRGDIIREIDGKPVMTVLEEKEKMTSGSPQLRRHRALNILGSKFKADDATDKYKFEFADNNLVNKQGSNGVPILIERGGKEKNIIVATSTNGNMFFNPVDERKYFSETIIEIEPGIYYINMAKCTEEEFEQKKNVLANAKAVIYDQRGGSRLNFFQIAPYMIDKPVNSAWWNIPLTIYPDRKEMEFIKTNWDIQPKKPLFKSKSVIINVPSVVSAGETMMSIIDHYNLATTVGETTAGCNGNVNTISMPCGYYAWFTGMKVLKHDGSQLYLKGFEPDYPVKRTMQAIREGRDEFLEKALEVARRI